MQPQTFDECKNELNTNIVNAFYLANNSYNEATFNDALTGIRRCLEYVCKAIVFYKFDHLSDPLALEEASSAVEFIERQNLNNLINKIGSQRLKWFSVENDENKNRSRREEAHSCRIAGNPGAHAEKATYKDVEAAKVYIRKIIEWFYDKFLDSEIPAEIKKALNDKPISVEEREKKNAIFNYTSELKEEYNEVVLNDTQNMRLSDIYIKPAMKMWEFSIAEEYEYFLPYFDEDINDEDIDDEDIIAHPPIDLHDFSLKFIQNKLADFDFLMNPEAQMLIVLGYPGQGKTSYCKRLQHDLLHKNKEELLLKIKLRDIESVEDLFSSPTTNLVKYIREELDVNLSKKELYSSTLILDGLDELAMRSNTNINDVDRFIIQLIQSLERDSNFKIILTSRYGYINLDRLENENVIVGELGPMPLGQQIEWLKKYRVFHPQTNFDTELLKKISLDNQYASIRELINQPILLHLIVSSGLDLGKQNTRAQIYESIFDKLIARSWENNKQITGLKGLTKETLREFLREIAFTIYSSEHEYILEYQLKQLPTVKNFLSEIGRNKDDVSAILRHLMIAFYMKDKKKSSEDEETQDKRNYAIEFLHKSFQEYLVAEKIWWEVSEFAEKNRGKYIVSDPNEALTKISDLLSTRSLSYEVEQYLIEIIQLDKDVDKEILYNRLFHFTPHFLQYQFYSPSKKTHPINKSLNTFKSFWAIFTEIANKKNTLPEQCQDDFMQLFNLYNTNNKDYKWNLKGIKLRDVTLSNLYPAYINFSNAKLYGVTFRNTALAGNIFTNALLENVTFSFSTLTTIHFTTNSYSNVIGMYNSRIYSCLFKGINLKLKMIHSSTRRGRRQSRIHTSKNQYTDCQFIHTSFDTYFFSKNTLKNSSFTNCENLDLSQAAEVENTTVNGQPFPPQQKK